MIALRSWPDSGMLRTMIHKRTLRTRIDGPQRARIAFIVTTGKSASLLMKGQLAYLAEQGFDVTVIGAADRHLSDMAEREQVRVVPLAMSRSIHPLHDLRALWKLWRILRQIKPHIVNASTPKAGLLGSLAGRLAGVPLRIYTLRGLRLATTRGWRRRILAAAERLATACVHRVWCVSRSLAREYASLGLAPATKIDVLGHGSSNGVDAVALAPTAAHRARGQELRRRLGIPRDAPVIGFVGRLTRDKGIADLAEAFDQVQQQISQARLLLVGDWESDDPVDPAVRRAIECNDRIVLTDFVTDAASYYHAMDVLAFPSYREGMPNAVLEAQAAGLPVTGYAATGVIDAIIDGHTGRLAPVGDAGALARRLTEYLTDAELRNRHGRQGRERVVRDFSRPDVWTLLRTTYVELLEERGIAARLLPTCDVPAKGMPRAA